MGQTSNEFIIGILNSEMNNFMLGITLMAIITTCLALSLIGGIITFKSPSRIRLILFLLFLVNIPLFFFAYYGLRLPLDEIIHNFIINDDIYGFITNFYAPVTEESSKLFLFLPTYQENVVLQLLHQTLLRVHH